MDKLGQFLTNYEQLEIWLLIPPGLVSGKLQNMPADDMDPIEIENAYLYVGDDKKYVGTVTVRKNEIYAWGPGSFG